ncbi:hypothetical protein B0H13DRAFT_1157848 [Mycena leptocephala]|nr:hypothetical protein B0H13DRAFT_1157848 [Mycena leptocephala]
MQLALPTSPSSPRHNHDRLQIECVALRLPEPPSTQIPMRPTPCLWQGEADTPCHAQPTIPPLAFDADVLITCPFAATILVAIRPSRSTPPLMHGESGAHHHARAQRSRRPFLITGAALFGCERTTKSAARDGPQLSPHAPGCFAITPRTTPRADRPRSSCPPSLAPRSPPPRPPRPSPSLPPPPPLDTTACLYLGTPPPPVCASRAASVPHHLRPPLHLPVLLVTTVLDDAGPRDSGEEGEGFCGITQEIRRTPTTTHTTTGSIYASHVACHSSSNAPS